MTGRDLKSLRYTLVSDGSTDRMLLPILTWLLHQHYPDWAVDPQWADWRRVREVPKGLADRIRVSLDLYPCEILFVHRDAERDTHAFRVQEIDKALKQIARKHYIVHVVPVRMTEAWLLIDEQAIRRAAGRPDGKQSLRMPRIKTLEDLSDPKQTLFELLRQTSELTGRRRDRFKPYEAAHRVSQLIEDFSPLRGLPAFQALETEIKSLQL